MQQQTIYARPEQKVSSQIPTQVVYVEQKPKKSIAGKIYSGTAAVGRVVEFVGAIFATIIGILLIIGGISAFSSDKQQNGWYLIIGGVAVIILGWFIYWLTRKSKLFAAFAGADAIVRAL